MPRLSRAQDWFYVASQAGMRVGVPFILWIGIFSPMVIAQFWACASDIHTPEEGKWLFAVIAFVASSGAVFGAWLSGRLIEAFGVRPLLLAAHSGPSTEDTVLTLALWRWFSASWGLVAAVR